MKTPADELLEALKNAALNLDACAVAIKKGGRSEGRHALVEGWAERARSAISNYQSQDGWRPIEEYDGCFPVVAARPAYSADQFGPATAFLDVGGTWRVYLSDGGMDPLPFEPTHWQPLPPPPLQDAGRG